MSKLYYNKWYLQSSSTEDALPLLLEKKEEEEEPITVLHPTVDEEPHESKVNSAVMDEVQQQHLESGQVDCTFSSVANTRMDNLHTTPISDEDDDEEDYNDQTHTELLTTLRMSGAFGSYVSLLGDHADRLLPNDNETRVLHSQPSILPSTLQETDDNIQGM